jgi:hypothetical protein
MEQIMEQKQNDFKRKRFEVMTPLEYYRLRQVFSEEL